MVQEIILQLLKCSRCGHKWIPRIVPVMCPKCKSYYWNEDKDTRENPIKKNIIK